MRFSRLSCPILILAVTALSMVCFAQSETGSLAGVVSDQKGAMVSEADVTTTRTETNTTIATKTNSSGVFAFPSLHPGHYRVQVRATGFKEIVLKDVELHVQDKLQRNFSLEVGTVSEIVNVEGGITPLNTQDATVSTVADRQFAENLPMNSRSFQTPLNSHRESLQHRATGFIPDNLVWTGKELTQITGWSTV